MKNVFDFNRSNEFNWSDIGDIKLGRTNLGEDMPVMIYRMLQSTLRNVLIKDLGEEATAQYFRSAGKMAGIAFTQNILNTNLSPYEFIAELQTILRETKIGILKMERLDIETGHALMSISEDLSCSGMPILGQTICYYTEGFIAGIFYEYTKKDYEVKEIDCWSTGGRICRFEARMILSQNNETFTPT